MTGRSRRRAGARLRRRSSGPGSRTSGRVDRARRPTPPVATCPLVGRARLGSVPHGAAPRGSGRSVPWNQYISLRLCPSAGQGPLGRMALTSGRLEPCPPTLPRRWSGGDGHSGPRSWRGFCSWGVPRRVTPRIGRRVASRRRPPRPRRRQLPTPHRRRSSHVPLVRRTPPTRSMRPTRCSTNAYGPRARRAG